jgi:hypothetical protein
VNHLSCWRSTPRERLKRTVNEITEASPHRSARGKTAFSRGPVAWNRAGCSINCPRNCQSEAAIHAKIAIGTALIHATQRHRGEGARPVGNNRGKKTRVRKSPGNQTHAESHATSAPRGSEPGSVTSAYVAYCSANNESP